MRRIFLALVAMFVVFGTAQAREASIVQTAAESGKFNTLINALVATGLDGALKTGEFTVFAPTEEAFAKLPAGTIEKLLKPENREMLVGILKVHVVPAKLTRESFTGSVSTLNGPVELAIDAHHRPIVNGVPIRGNSIPCTNGKILVIDQVLMPTAKAESKRTEPKPGNILGVAQKAGNFKILLKAIEVAGLTEILDGDGPFTVFAPTDEAFAKLPEGTIAKLLTPAGKEDLIAILKYHVVAGKVSAKQAVAAGKATSLLGKGYAIELKDGQLTIKKSKVIANDIGAGNGVIHVIDTVLLP